MAEHPFLPLATDAYLGDTMHLTTTEHGAYLLLLMAMWRSRDGHLPNDDRMLARTCRLTTTQWARIRPTIMAFMTVSDAGVSQGRLMDERAFVKRKSQSQSDKANARWLKEKASPDAAAVPMQCPPPHPTEEENSVPNGTGSEAAAGDGFVDPVKVMFDAGRRLLAGSGIDPRKAGAIIGKWRGDHGTEAVIAALGRAQREGAVDPVAFIEGCLKFQAKRSAEPAYGEERVRPNGERIRYVGGTVQWERVYA